MTTQQKRSGVSADFMSSFMSSLEEVAQAATGYGTFMSGVITSQEYDDGPTITATWSDNQWLITTGGGS